MRARSIQIIGLVLLAALAWPRASLAEGQAKMTAKEHYKKGLSLYGLGKYNDAAVEYEAAFEMEPDPALLYNAAQAHRLAGNKQRALMLYQSFLRMFPKSDDGSVQKHIAALKTAIEAEGRAEHSPPIDTRPPADKHEPETHVAPTTTTTAPTTTAPTTTAPTTTAPANPALVIDISRPPPPRKKRVPVWVWGVAAGAVVLGVSLGVGLGVGLSGNTYPTPTLGGGRVP